VLAVPSLSLAATADDLAAIRDAIRQLEQRRQEDQARIEMLERRLSDADAQLRTVRSGQVSSPASTQPAPSASTTAMRRPTTANLPAAARPGVTSGPSFGTRGGSASAFNPAIGAVLQGTFSHFSRDPDNRVPGFMVGEEATIGDRGFSLGETEINLSASVDHLFYAEATLAHPREGGVEVEEAFVQTTGLPWGLTVKGGRFFSGIGYMNEQHSHAWDFIDPALPYRVMLNTQYGDDGIQLRWLAPTEHFLEFGAEGFRGDSFPATATNNGKGSVAAFVRTGGDFGASHSWLAGLSYLHADADNRATNADTFTGGSDLGIASLVYKWAPGGNPSERNLKLQGEFFYRDEDGTFNGLAYSGRQFGWYAHAVFQFMPQWRLGARYDQLSARALGAEFAGTTLDDLGRNPRRVSGLLEYETSEFGRFRLQYNHDRATQETNHEVFLNYVVSIGAHGAHKY